MTDDVVEKVARAIDLRNLNWDNGFPPGVWKKECLKQAKRALSTLQPGDEINGMVLVPRDVPKEIACNAVIMERKATNGSVLLSVATAQRLYRYLLDAVTREIRND